MIHRRLGSTRGPPECRWLLAVLGPARQGSRARDACTHGLDFKKRLHCQADLLRVMAGASRQARYEVQHTPAGQRVRLAGRWDLLTRTREQRKLRAALYSLPSPEQIAWDLSDVEALDGAGALLLWNIWGRTLPQTLHCRDEQRLWFERLAAIPNFEPPRRWQLRHPLTELGRLVVAVLRGAGEMLVLTGQLLLDAGYSIRHPRSMPWKELSAGIYRIGASSLILLGGVAFLIGIVMTYQIGISLTRFGANVSIVDLLSLSMLRELGPVITSIIVMGRSGSAITASLGAMHVTRELAALRAFGASPTQRLVLPKVAAMVISVPLLVVWVDCVGMLGGIVTADRTLGVGYQIFITRLPETVALVNFWIGIVKGAVFGLVIGIVSGYFGLKVRPDTQSLSTQITNSVVTGLTLILALDASSGAMLTGVGLW